MMSLFYFCIVFLIFAFVVPTNGNTIITSSEHVCGDNMGCYLEEAPTTLILNSTGLTFATILNQISESIHIDGLGMGITVSCALQAALDGPNLSISLSGFTLEGCQIRFLNFENVTLENMVVKGNRAFMQVVDSRNVAVLDSFFQEIEDIVRLADPLGLWIETAETVSVINCKFIHNIRGGLFFDRMEGQGIIATFISVPKVVINSCLFKDNYIVSTRKAMNAYSASLVYLNSDDVQILNSTFIGNTMEEVEPFEDRCTVGVLVLESISNGGSADIDSCVFENTTCVKQVQNNSTTTISPAMIGSSMDITIRNTTTFENSLNNNTGGVFDCPSTPTNLTCGCSYSDITTYFVDCQANVTCEGKTFIPPTPAPTVGTLPPEIVLSGRLTINGDFVNSDTATIIPGGFLQVEGCIVIPPNTTFIIDLTRDNSTSVGETRREVIRSNSNCINGTFTVLSPECVLAELEQTLSSVVVITSRSDRCDDKKGSANVGIALGVTFGILVLIAVALIVAFFVPKLRQAIYPYTLRTKEVKIASVPK